MPLEIDKLLDLDVVRNVLTVSESDLPDHVLEDYGLEDEIAILLDKFVPDWGSLDEVEDSKTIRKLRVYTKYKAAAIVAVTAPVFILKKISDGENEGQRSDKEGFLWLEKALQDKADRVLEEILEDLGITKEPATFSLTALVKPSRDVITQVRGG
jgi:hypothetical protein